MRSARWVVLALLVPSAAGAEVYQNRVLECPPGEMGVAKLTTSSRVLFINSCMPNGCVVKKGNADSALTDTSSLSSGTNTLAAYQNGAESFDRVFACVQDIFSPFDIQVVRDDPGTANHFEVVAAGTSSQLSATIMGAGGIAPFIGCNAQRDNVLSFVFANQTDNEDYLCTAIAHEAGHTYGLSHSLDPLDPMTYMNINALKSWQNNDQVCGTETPEECRCFPDTQNSFRYLMTTFGLSPTLAPNEIAIDRPKPGAYVKAGFPITATWTSPLQLLEGALTVDGGAVQPVVNKSFIWNAATTLAAGTHTLQVSATDYGDRTAMASVTVNVMASCAAGEDCADGFGCLGGTCYPLADVEGGLGAECAGNADCSTGVCASDNDNSYCTATCDAGATCPDGFECLDGAAVCWPADEGGGCSTTQGASWIVGLALLALRRRRRTARA